MAMLRKPYVWLKLQTNEGKSAAGNVSGNKNACPAGRVEQPTNRTVVLVSWFEGIAARLSGGTTPAQIIF